MQCVQLYIHDSFYIIQYYPYSSVEYSCRRNGESSGQEVVYFQNEDYPQATSTPNMCLFRISIKDDSICQLRIDFDEFVLDAGSDVNAPCDRDSLELFSGGTTSLGKVKSTVLPIEHPVLCNLINYQTCHHLACITI
jgi:hypothetical protein